MYLYRKKWFVICLVLTVSIFSLLYWARYYRHAAVPVPFMDTSDKSVKISVNNEIWKSIFINNEKSGYSVSKTSQNSMGYLIHNTVFFHFKTMGLVQAVIMETTEQLKDDFSLDSFDMAINSDLFSFRASGDVDDSFMKVRTRGAGSSKNQYSINIRTVPYTVNGILMHVFAKKTGEAYQYAMFDPLTMGFIPVAVKIMGTETIDLAGIPTEAIALKLFLKGMSHSIWTDRFGRILLEKGMLGMKLVTGTKNEALSGISKKPVHDMTVLAAVAVDKPIEHPAILTELTIELTGFDLPAYQLESRRQTLDGNKLTIRKEPIIDGEKFKPAFMKSDFLSPGPLIQSDSPEITALAHTIIKNETSDMGKIKKLVSWVYDNIEKRPAPFIPDALYTLHTRQGDCNEHAVLLAALGRAAGIPSRIETGLYYMNGKFMYHAWNAFHAGEWITADSVFNQIPADVTHVKISSSKEGGGTELAGILGKINIKIVDWK